MNVLVAGVAGLVAGAMSMAAGEYVSVHSQSDTERADIELERRELATNPLGEHNELKEIYVRRGLEPALSRVKGPQSGPYGEPAICRVRCADLRPRRRHSGRNYDQGPPVYVRLPE